MSVNGMIWQLFRPRPQDRSIAELYGAIVAQARQPAFYRDYGVPDTVAGRFDLIVLHLVLAIERLGRNPDTGRGIGQRLFDAFCRDLDANLREMGVGDLAVPKRMRGFGEAFYGRQAAYLAAFAAPDAGALEMALRRNIFAEADAESGANGALRLARYVRAVRRRFEDQEDAALLRGEVSFPQPDRFAEAIDHA
jgi:cytochrome b pre-mRNA-processing protein 3